MHSCNNTVASRVTVHVQTVLLQQQHTLAVVFVHNLYGKVSNVQRQNSCDEFYKVV